jgi:hypothetical protein
MTEQQRALLVSSRITPTQAAELYRSGWWCGVGDREVAAIQLRQRLLCLPWEAFHEAVVRALGREVYSHEFVDPVGLLRELGAKS